jgi:hypothetical protein
MTYLSIANRIFNRQILHSKASEQELIDKLAKQNEKSIYAVLQDDDGEAQEIGGDAFCEMDEEVAAEIIRRALRGGMQDALIMRQLILAEVDASVRRTAELRAIRHVEAMTPEEFLPD